MAGAFVSIPEESVTRSDVQSTPTAYWMNLLWDEVGKYKTDLDAAVNNMQAVVGTFNPKTTIPAVLAPTLDAPVFPARPAWPPLNLDDGWPTTFPTPEAMLPYGDIDFNYVAPTAPSEIDGNFTWVDGDYSSEMWNALFNKVHSDILNGGTGLTDAVHATIIARERESRRVNQDTEYRRGLDAVGARGFNLPSGQVAAFQRDVIVEMLNKDQDSLNNIIIKDFDLATENTRFAVTTGASLEQLLRATYEAAQQRGFEAEKATKDYLIAVYEANINKYLAEWEGVKAGLEALKTKIDAIASYNDGNVKIFLGNAEAYKTQIDAITAKNDGLVNARQGEVDVYKAEVQAISSQYSALVEEMRANVEVSRLEITSAIETAKIDLSAYVSESELAQRVASDIGNIAMQATASALSGINTSISNSHSASESRSEGWSHGESLGETHGYSES